MADEQKTQGSEQPADEAAMNKMAAAPPEPGDKGANGKKRRDEELDEGLECTFPASDPPANVQPGHDQPAPSSGYDEAAKNG